MVAQGTFLVKLYFSVHKEEQARRFYKRHTDPLRELGLNVVIEVTMLCGRGAIASSLSQ